MMVVTHEMGFARKVAHRVIFMDEGRIVEDAPKDDFFGKPALRARAGVPVEDPAALNDDVAIIGGGVIGCAAAYFLKRAAWRASA